VEDDYDFENFFGSDILDSEEPEPSIVAGMGLLLEQVSVDDISGLIVERTPLEHEDGNYGGTITRTVYPLSDIMALVDERVREKWAAMDPPFVPGAEGAAPDILDREWPPHRFWESCFRKEYEELVQPRLKREIDKNYRIINARLRTLGLSHLINHT
jgi:hypothetical protein